MSKVKRDRSANFSLRERDILVSLVQKYQGVLENKQSDASTWKMKEAAWESIQKEFNARCGGILRSTKTLKVKYEGLKRTVRKKSAAIRSELYRTGGGQNTAPPLDNVEEQIKSMITVSTDGLESIYDSDLLPQTEGIQDSTNVIKFQPSLMQMGSLEVEGSKDTENQVIIEVIEKPLQKLNIDLEIIQEETTTIPNNDKNLPDTPSRNLSYFPPSTSGNKKWDVSNRKNLKSRKHPALITATRKTLDELTQAKLQLIQLQKEFLEAEIIEKKKVWEFEENERKKEADFKEKERKWKEEVYKRKLNNNFE